MADEAFRVIKGNATGAQISIGDEFLIGRVAEGEGKLGDDPELSRQHARVSRSGDSDPDRGSRLDQRHLRQRSADLGSARAQDRATRSSWARPPSSSWAPEGRPHRSPGRQESRCCLRSRTAPAPAPGRASSRRACPRRAAAAGAPAAGRKGPPVPLLAALGGLLVAIVIAVVVLAGGGDDSEEDSAETLSTNRRATVVINTKGPESDDEGNQTVAAGGGTGIIVDADKGMVLTNAHVVAGQTSIKATVGGDEVNARVLGQAPCEDLAVIQLNPKPAEPHAGRARGRQGHGNLRARRSRLWASRAPSRRRSPSASSRPRRARSRRPSGPRPSARRCPSCRP